MANYIIWRVIHDVMIHKYTGGSPAAHTAEQYVKVSDSCLDKDPTVDSPNVLNRSPRMPSFCLRNEAHN